MVDTTKYAHTQSSYSPAVQGIPPFAGDSDEESFALTLRGRYDKKCLQDVSDAARDLVAQMLTYHPEKVCKRTRNKLAHARTQSRTERSFPKTGPYVHMICCIPARLLDSKSCTPRMRAYMRSQRIDRRALAISTCV